MKVPFNWLKEFTPVAARADEVAERLTMRGLEVEGLEQILPAFSSVYVGEIVEIEKNDPSGKLSLCRVDIGTDVLPIVCGAPNVARAGKYLWRSRAPGLQIISSLKKDGSEE